MNPRVSVPKMFVLVPLAWRFQSTPAGLFFPWNELWLVDRPSFGQSGLKSHRAPRPQIWFRHLRTESPESMQMFGEWESCLWGNPIKAAKKGGGWKNTPEKRWLGELHSISKHLFWIAEKRCFLGKALTKGSVQGWEMENRVVLGKNQMCVSRCGSP